MKVLLALVGIGAAALFWSDALRAREVALRRVRALCGELGLQLLDDTVRLVRLWPCRGRDGRLRLCRRYRFEFSVRAVERCEGEVALEGRRVVQMRLDHPQGRLFLDPQRRARPRAGV